LLVLDGALREGALSNAAKALNAIQPSSIGARLVCSSHGSRESTGARGTERRT
jgi:hypothetical protein